MENEREKNHSLNNTKQIEFYKNYWLNKQYITHVGPASRQTRRHILKMLDKISFNSLLDVGCGEGSLLLEIKRKWPDTKLYGIDLSAEALKLASAKVETTFLPMNLESEFIDFQIDVTVCSEVLEHIGNDIRLLEKIRENTQYLAISVPSGKMDKIDIEVGHKRRYSKEELKDKLERTGFRTLYMRNWGFPFYSPLYRSLFEKMPKSVRNGEVPFYKKRISLLIYYLFMFNMIDKGDRLFTLAEKI